MNLDSLLDSLAPGGSDFERLCKWVLENAPEYRRTVKRVWRWNDWPGRWGALEGHTVDEPRVTLWTNSRDALSGVSLRSRVRSTRCSLRPAVQT